MSPARERIVGTGATIILLPSWCRIRTRVRPIPIMAIVAHVELRQDHLVWKEIEGAPVAPTRWAACRRPHSARTLLICPNG